MTHPDASERAREVAALEAFVTESNRIEGIKRTTKRHISAHVAFLDGPVTIPSLIAFVGEVQPDARFRNKLGVPGVRVGDHVAPPSGPKIEADLRDVLAVGTTRSLRDASPVHRR